MNTKKVLAVLCLFVLFISTIPSSPIRAAGEPIAYWKFDDGSGTAPIDSSGNNVTGAFAGTTNPTWSTDVPSAIAFNDPYSLDFTGNHDGVTFSWPSGLNFGATAARSFSFWYKPVSNGETDSGQYDRIISWSSDQFEIAGTTGSNSNHTISYYDGNWNSTSLTLTLGTWYHITFTYDGTTAKFYIDNDEKDSHSLGGRALSGTMSIGTRAQTLDEGINGRIDDVRVYNYALSPTQISNLTAGSNNPDTTPTPSPTATPTSTTTPTSTPNSLPKAPSTCNDQKPSGSPDLFQISTGLTSATLYFTPVKTITGYSVSYGENQNADQYSANFNASESNGVLSYTVGALSDAKSYYFKIRALNNCVPGDWSQTVSARTTSLTSTPTPSKKELNLKITNTPTPKSTSQTERTAEPQTSANTHDVTIKVVTDEGEPIVGAQVSLHSTPMETITDKNGIARFNNVEKGEHTVTLSYNDYQGEEKVILDGEEKNVSLSFTVELKPSNTFLSPAAIIIISILGAGVVLLFFLWRRKGRR